MFTRTGSRRASFVGLAIIDAVRALLWALIGKEGLGLKLPPARVDIGEIHRKYHAA